MKHQTKEEMVAEYIREGIVSGKIPRGAKLKQADLAATLGTSITPVREAIKLLEAEGFVRGASHRGAVVAPFDMSQTEEIADLRVMLECKLALAAFQNCTQELIDDLRIIQAEIDAAVETGDRNAVRALNYRFHQAIYSAAKLPTTQHFVNILWARYPFDMINRVDGRIDRASHEHHDILRGLLTRDETALMAAMRTHVRAGWDEFKENYSSDGPVDRDAAGPGAA